MPQRRDWRNEMSMKCPKSQLCHRPRYGIYGIYEEHGNGSDIVEIKAAEFFPLGSA